MKISPFLVLVFCSSLLSNLAYANKTLSWQECIDLAKGNNSDLQAAEARLRAFEFQERTTFSGFLPSLNVSLNHTKNHNSFIGGGGGGGVPIGAAGVTTTFNTAQLTGSWNLFSGFQDLGRIEQAKANTRMQLAQLQNTKAQISFELKSAYQSLLFATEYAKLTQEITSRREENLRLVELRFESGLENKGSVLLSEANYEQAKYDNILALNAKRIATAQLAQVLGFDEFTEIKISDPIPTHDQEPHLRPDFKKVLLKNPEVLRVQAEEEVASQSLRISKSTFMPSLDLSGSAGRMRIEDVPGDRNTWSVGLSLSFPLFNGGQDYYGIKSASALLHSASSNLENTRRRVLARLEATYSSYVEAVAKLRVDKTFRDATSVRSEISRKRYNNGLITFDDWNIIEDDLILRQKIYIQSTRDRVIAEAAHEQALGQGVIP